MTVIQWHDGFLMAYAAMSVLVFVVLQFFIKVSYGRHDTEDRAWWGGPGVPTRVAWAIMEAPSSIGFAVIYFLGANAWQPVPLLLFALWQVHYFQRSFIYPFKRSVKPGDKTPLLLPLIALFTIIDPQWPLGPVSPELAEAPFMTGFQQGYLTMDALASMVFVRFATRIALLCRATHTMFASFTTLPRLPVLAIASR